MTAREVGGLGGYEQARRGETYLATSNWEKNVKRHVYFLFLLHSLATLQHYCRVTALHLHYRKHRTASHLMDYCILRVSSALVVLYT